MIVKINIQDKFNQFSDLWGPKIAGELNSSYVILLEPITTVITGNITNERTMGEEWI